MVESPRIYSPSPPGTSAALRQGEILDGLVQAHLELASLTTPPLRVALRTHPYAIVLTQGCELAQDFDARAQGSDKVIPSVLFCEVATAEEMRSRIKQSNIWDRVKINGDERYHFFSDVPASQDSLGQAIPELGVDFKRYFTIPTDEVYHRIGTGQARRRCYLVSPYLEHFTSRFANFLSRVALPEPHRST